MESKGKQKGKTKSKGKSKADNGTQKSKGKVKGKFSTNIGKGKGKPSKQPDRSNTCLYCGKVGHWKRDCRKYKHDQETGQVRQVEGGFQQVPPPPPGGQNPGFQQPGAQHSAQPHVSFVQPSSSTSYVQQPQQAVNTVRRFEFAPYWSDDSAAVDLDEYWIDDLTLDSLHHGSIRALAAVPMPHDALSHNCMTFDMTYSDNDDVWTVEAELDHLRMVEIILDSGADGSALPLEYSNTGVALASDDKLRFVDAQGSPLNISSTRLATVDFGGFSLKEEFIVASITSPLLSLGKLMKDGWNLEKLDNGLHLVKADKAIPVSFKRNSLCISGSIRMLEDSKSLHVRDVKLKDVLQRVKTTWSKLGPECFGIRTYKPVFVDVTMAPSASMLWHRTTLVKRFGRWHLLHHNLFVSDEFASGSLAGAMPEPSTVQEVLTFGHAKECTHAQLGFEVFNDALELLEPGNGNSSSSSRPPDVNMPQPVDDRNEVAQHEHVEQGRPLQVPQVDIPAADALAPFEPPMAPDEPAVDEVVAGPDEVLIDGTRIDSTSPLVVLKAACTALGVSTHGSRAQLFKRLVQHLQHQELLASHSVKYSLSKELQRPVNQPGIPAEPTEEEVREHNMTHIPFKPWCELCIAHKSRQDKHHREDHTSSEHSVVSFDFGYADRGTDETLILLCIHDRHTKMMHAVPTPSKGGRSLPYLSAELCRFVTWLGYQEVCLRTDNEPATLSLLEACRKALKGLGVHTMVELVVPGNKEANGAAEVTVQTIRNQANLLIEQIERAVGATDKVLFGASHPLYAWAVVHASWLHCRFAVANGETAYERSTGKEYHGRICIFGETCMGFLKPSAKGLASWQRGVWLGKTQNNDAHVISCNGGLFITRSVRRLPVPWVLSELGNVEISPWECSFATLGSKLMVPKRVLKPAPQTALALPPVSLQPPASKLSPFFDEEAEMVRNLPPTPMESVPDGLAFETLEATDSAGAPVMPAQAGSTLGPTRMMPPPPTAAATGLATRVDDLIDAPMSPSAEGEPVSKRARICMIAGVEYEHEDEHNYTSFTPAELDGLEEYELELPKDEPDEDVAEDGDLMQQLIFPYSDQEPCLTPAEMARLDAIAQLVEATRLKEMGVLLPAETVEGLEPKHLSTRFVTTWRDKVINGRRCWLRRARYVAREYAWLSPERQDLFSPASSNITNRLLPSLFLHWKKKCPEKRFTLAAIDIGDAFLTVPQVQPTLVSSGTETYALGRVLPGQRDGSQLWFESVSSFLKERLSFKHCEAYPSLLANDKCLILLHVDDMLVLTEQQYFDEQLISTLTSKYKTSVHGMKDSGDSFEFLKRIHTMVDHETIHIQQNPRHFDKLFEIVGVQNSMHSKKVPCHELMSEVDNTPALSPEKASRYRSAVGVLLYLASDLVECAFTIRGLAQFMSAPTERSWTMLKHLCLYLLAVRDNSLCLRICPIGLWHSPPNGDGMVLEMSSDSDWAAHKGHRRSVSSGIICFQGCVLVVTSRTQKVIALSSAEAEIHAAVSTTCDGILLRVCIEFCIQEKVRLKIILDNSAAKQILQRSGVGRVRHLSCRILWIQQMVKQRQLEPCAIPTKYNYADLGTKKLSPDRMQFLMYGVGVFDEQAGALVGAEVFAKEQTASDFRGVLRMLRESVGEKSHHKTMVSAKRSLQALLLMTLVNECDALSLVSPIAFLIPEPFSISSFSCAMFSMVILLCVFISAFAMMPPQQIHVLEPEPEAETAIQTPVYNKAVVYCFLFVRSTRSGAD